jgi:DNA-binding response OmpR family regulator
MPRILIIEDNPDLLFGLRNNLEIEGYDVDVAEDGVSGLQRVRSGTPDLIILDLMIPGIDGYRVLRTLRDEGYQMPVLILSARIDEADRVRGLKHGADDYVTKPFSLLELIARVEALLRRAQIPLVSSSKIHRFGSVTVDAASRQVTRAGNAVALSPREFALLLALLERRGEAVSRQDLMRVVWGHQAEVTSRTVDTHIADLRQKLEDDPASPRHILTVFKTGYRLQT